ncbi:MAG TPA: hypothetical protein VLE43_17720 [Candidatus Saccharimonadia bacterium]|nr:hypothetical protein [Candidatus Saccharimonadia bacterium]
MMMLTTPSKELGGEPTTEFPRVYGVLMDFPVADGEATATVLSTSTGTASLYTTSTFSIIGGEGHASVRKAAKAFVSATERFFDEAKPTTIFPYPSSDRIRFYFLTFSGVRVIETDLASMEKGTNKHLELFVLGQSVLTELRLLAEARQ